MTAPIQARPVIPSAREVAAKAADDCLDAHLAAERVLGDLHAPLRDIIERALTEYASALVAEARRETWEEAQRIAADVVQRAENLRDEGLPKGLINTTIATAEGMAETFRSRAKETP